MFNKRSLSQERFILNSNLDINEFCQTFIHNPSMIMYVKTKEIETIHGMGIITCGNLKRHIYNHEDLVHYKFNYYYEQDVDNVEKLFEENEKINVIPIVDKETNRLLYEYVREESSYDMIQRQKEEDVINKIMSIGYATLFDIFENLNATNITFISDNRSNKIIQIFQEIANNYSLSLSIISNNDFYQSYIARNKCTNNTIFVDINITAWDIRKSMYFNYERQLYKDIVAIGIMDFMRIVEGCMLKNINMFSSSLQLVSKVFHKIGIYGDNILSAEVMKYAQTYGNEAYSLDIKGNDRDNIISSEEPEVIISFTLDTINMGYHNPLKVNNKEVYSFNLFTMIFYDIFYVNNSINEDYDIALNIVPYLTDKNVRVLILDNPTNSKHMLKDSNVIKHLPKRGLEKCLDNK